MGADALDPLSITSDPWESRRRSIYNRSFAFITRSLLDPFLLHEMREALVFRGLPATHHALATKSCSQDKQRVSCISYDPRVPRSGPVGAVLCSTITMTLQEKTMTLLVSMTHSLLELSSLERCLEPSALRSPPPLLYNGSNPMRRTTISLVAILSAALLCSLSACQSAPEPKENTQKLRTGAEIATSTGDQTRAALEKEPGLVLYASSIPDEPAQPKPTRPEKPPVTEPAPDTTDAPETSPEDASTDGTRDTSATPDSTPKAKAKEKDASKKDAPKPDAKPDSKPKASSDKTDGDAKATDL